MNITFINKRFITCVICLYSLSAIAQHEYDSVFKIPYPKRYEVINLLLKTSNDSAINFAVADRLIKQAIENRNDWDKLVLEVSKLGLELDFHVGLPGIEQRALNLERQAENINCYPVICQAYTVIGNYHFNITHNFKAGFEYYLRAYYIFHRRKDLNFPDLSYNQYVLANSYYTFYDYENALKYIRDLVETNQLKYPWNDKLAKDLAGMCYLKLGKYDSAVLYFQKTLKIAQPDSNPWIGIATGNIGMAWYFKRNYDTALLYLKSGADICKRENIYDNTATFSVYIARIFMLSRNLTEAGKYLANAKDAAYKSNSLQNYCELYDAQVAYYRHLHNAKIALQNIDSLVKFKDSLNTLIDVSKKYSAEGTVMNELRILNDKVVEKEVEKQILLRNGLIILVLMLMGFVLFFYRSKLIQLQLRKKTIQAQKQATESELVHALEQLENFKRNIDEKNLLIASMEKEITGSMETGVIAKLQQSTFLTDEQWENFRQLFEKVQPGFMQKLKVKLPGLSPAEIRFMVLAKLNFSNKEMASALGVSSQAIRTTWYRLRKKLNLPEEGTLEELVENI